jgi:hypothetical protein
MSLELTQEEKLKSVDAAHDSVLLINQLNAKGKLTDYETDTLSRNVEHIKIMLAKDWFVEILTPAQKTELESLV